MARQIRDRSMTAVLRDAVFATPKPGQQSVSQRIADAVIAKASTGDIRAVEWLYDRIDGPITSTQQVSPVNIIMAPKKISND